MDVKGTTTMNRTCTIVITNSPAKELLKAINGEPMVGHMELTFAGHTLMAKWATSKKGEKILGEAQEFYVKFWHNNPKNDGDYDMEFLASAGCGTALKNTGVFIDRYYELRELAKNAEEAEKDMAYAKGGK